MSHPHSSDLQSLLKEKRDEIIQIASRHGAFNVRVFGSVARGEANEHSDIDFLVDYSLDRITPWFPAGLMLDLEKLLECKIDIATEESLKERIRDRVLQEAVPL
ncbi:MAG: nucleotidyltransferase family protein [Leptolyngbya sp. SIO1E4]|nr:nucleotidyltransferase family protein [Leptolyngbya sp. SIO1E4]